jgi:hypothetical protein
VIAPVRCLPPNARISALCKLPCSAREGLANSPSDRRGKVRDFEQLFGCTLFDDGNCEEPIGSIATRIHEPFVLLVSLKKWPHE